MNGVKASGRREDIYWKLFKTLVAVSLERGGFLGWLAECSEQPFGYVDAKKNQETAGFLSAVISLMNAILQQQTYETCYSMYLLQSMWWQQREPPQKWRVLLNDTKRVKKQTAHRKSECSMQNLF